jgi:hypothetical protein
MLDNAGATNPWASTVNQSASYWTKFTGTQDLYNRLANVARNTPCAATNPVCSF